eukprot:TRINITY_DN16214_c0_g1_i1.p1 TRINITY_DN16214_c0_g1~~TRINITY_DN16214_c0_g1_i1.p1  ORF type:complete len:382 (+),score=165.79 TRINITY_DN16214_c0_g1_i1:55-1200(+)
MKRFGLQVSNTAARRWGSTVAPPRCDWTKDEVAKIYDMPLLDLMHKAASVHRENFDSNEVQQATLLSLKTGGCTEDCGYCSQSSKHKTFVKPSKFLEVDHVLEKARKAKAAGSTRFCMGTAWREAGKKHSFNRVVHLVKEVSAMGMETCCTLGMLTKDQAKELREAGLTAYNHNLDTSREHYPNVVSTRSYDERLQTVENVREAGISVCCGGILGIDEKEEDRVGLIHTLATLPEHPESVPINALVAVPGTPLGDRQIAKGGMVTWMDMIRAIATARIVMPKTMVRLSAGRKEFSVSEQAMMFYCGANSIFTGDQLLTTANPEFMADAKMFTDLGLKGKVPYTGATAKFKPSQWDDVEDDESFAIKTTVVGSVGKVQANAC